MDQTNAVLYQRKGTVAEITLNRPESLNAMNLALIEGLFQAVKKAEEEKGLRLVVLKGSGRCFCAGGDIKFFRSQLESETPVNKEMPDRLHTMIEKLRALPLPVLASIHGSAGGAGTSLALACDLVVCADDVKFNLAYCRIGLSPDGGSTYFLPRHVGLKKAMEIFLASQNLTAQEALALGLINKIVPAADLQKTTETIAEIISLGATEAFARTKKLLNASFHNSLHNQLSLESEMIVESARTHDFREGVTAFLEKRMPEFKGN
ncbi:MAG: enoyl-CoA hydratase/isomerase family protein [Deltaproteobacteria bacterium]|nr:enoyl-CoA hydratase/isomerase family protein [Deltaproteobacteria bacterium]